MNVLVIGATGYIGRAVAEHLRGAGHTVIGLVRNDNGARELTAAGFAAVGDARAAGEVDVVIDAANADDSSVTTMVLDTLRGVRLIRTSGTGLYTDLAGGEPSDIVHTEDDGYQPIPALAHRHAIDQSVLAAGGVVLRPSMIYGLGGSEQLPFLLRAATRDRVARYTGRGLNRYGNVHLDDLAEAYVCAVEHARPGSVYNLAADEAELGAIAEGIGKLLDIPSVSATLEETVTAFGPRWALGIASNSRVDSAKARTELGWAPQGPTLLDDLVSGSYRRVWADKQPTVRP
jgi:nucleoside-diphosphate-sugar epimerase